LSLVFPCIDSLMSKQRTNSLNLAFFISICMKEYVLTEHSFKILLKRCNPLICHHYGEPLKPNDKIVSIFHGFKGSKRFHSKFSKRYHKEYYEKLFINA
jgi:hypothetical protein